jgi:hypothetical protein
MKITGKQSRSARSLLKWNIHDLANRVKGIVAKRIDSFEHGMVHLMEWENDEIVKSFKSNGIVFKADLEVALEKGGKTEKEKQQVSGSGGEGMRVTVTAEEVMLASPADPASGAQPAASREDATRKKKDGTY